jgi:asparagine synthase (glutamine-hydrolysing)
MCGICGVVSSAPLGEAERDAVRAMNASLFRRGPDGEGFYEDTHVMLGMRRLAIIDLTGGWQPLFNEDKSIALVANGEVYNFVELRADLIARGHQPRTKSDCELPAHIYEDKGLEFVHDLRGMYAIALWDTRRHQLHLVRDRVGEKPLFLFEHTVPPGRPNSGAKVLYFASEMKALLASGVVKFELEPTAVDEFMHFQWVHDPRTAIKGVRKLPPASTLSIDVHNWQKTERVYWRMEDAPPISADPGPTIRAELDRVSELIIRSEVPVGVALSGGIDSSTVACLAASKYPGMMKAFSIGWSDAPQNDERASARALAKRLGIPIHEIEIHPSEASAFFPQLSALMDDPIADIAGYAYYVLNKLSREHGCPVLLQGQGGDELFWGYPWARKALRETIYKLKHGRTRRTSLREALLPRDFSRGGLVELAFRLGGTAFGWRQLRLPHDSNTDRAVFWDLMESFQTGAWGRQRVFTPAFRESLGDFDAAWPFTVKEPRPSPEVLLTKLQCAGYLLENGINQGDRLSMANSVELRLPLVDYKLIETVIGLRKAHPGDHEGGTKHWLRLAVQDVVPAEIFNRPKRGFNPPVTQWTTSLRNLYAADLRDGYLVQSGVITPEAAREMTRDTSRLSAWNQAFFKCLTLEMWSRGMMSAAQTARAVARPVLQLT